MKVLIWLTLITIAGAKNIEKSQPFPSYAFNKNYAIPLGDEIRAFEERNRQMRIVGGSASELGQFPYQAGVLTNFVGSPGTGVCGGCLLSHNRVIHAAHCWDDGYFQPSQVTVVLGSTTLFSGGTRLASKIVFTHPEWSPFIIRNDVAVIYLPISVEFSDIISPVSLPSGSQLEENFTGQLAVASGYGLTRNGGTVSTSQSLNHVELTILSNNACRIHFPSLIVDSNICTSGAGGKSTCSGDSGGPLAVTRDNQSVLVGITSFGSSFGCEGGFPAAYARVSSFIKFFKSHL